MSIVERGRRKDAGRERKTKTFLERLKEKEEKEEKEDRVPPIAIKKLSPKMRGSIITLEMKGGITPVLPQLQARKFSMWAGAQIRGRNVSVRKQGKEPPAERQMVKCPSIPMFQRHPPENPRQPRPERGVSTLRVAREVKSMVDDAKSLFASKNRKHALEKMKEVIVKTTQENDFGAAGAAFIICALIEYGFKNYSVACEYLVQLRNVANSVQDQALKICAYRYLGLCFHHLNMHEHALKCFKKELVVAWEARNLASELECYDFIGIQYYYLGDLDKAGYYHDRMMLSQTEMAQDGLHPTFHKFVHPLNSSLKPAHNLGIFKDLLKQQYKKYYQKLPSRPASPESDEQNFFSISTQRFFTKEKQKEVDTMGTTTDFSTFHRARKNGVIESVISTNPADLSLSDLPSPRLLSDAPKPGNPTEDQQKQRYNSVFRSPSILEYITKRSKRMQPTHRPRNQSHTKLLSARQTLSNWLDNKNKKGGRQQQSVEKWRSQKPNQPIVITHLSPYRANKRAFRESLVQTILKAFRGFPAHTKYVALHQKD